MKKYIQQLKKPMMMRIILLYAFSILTLNINAQHKNFTPFVENFTYQYLNANEDTVNSLRVVNSKNMGKFQVFDFNPVLKHFGGIDSNNIFLGKMIKTEQDYLFVSTNTLQKKSLDTILIRADAKLNDTWVLCNKPKINATVVQIKNYSFLGIYDTVKVINLDNGGIIYLSKNYGMVKTIDFLKMVNGVVYELNIDAIPEMNLGVFASDPFNIFNYNIGDKFLTVTHIYPTDIKYVDTEIISKKISSNKDSLIYEAYLDTLIIRMNYENDTLYKAFGRKKAVIIITRNGISNDRRSLFLLSSEENFGNANYSITYNSKEKKYIYTTLGANVGHIFPTSIYISGLGRVKIYHSPNSFSTVSFDLLCNNNRSFSIYQNGGIFKDNDQVCQNYRNRITTINDKIEQIGKNSISLFPNPTNTTLNIQSKEVMSKYIIYQSNGTKVLETSTTESIDVSALPEGLYLLEAWDKEGRRALKKFEKR